MIQSLAHVCLKTVALDQTAAFYCGALGLRKLFGFTREGKPIGFYLQVSPGAFIEVFLEGETARGGDSDGNPTLNHFCLETDDIERVRQSLLDHRYAPGEIKMGCDHSLQFWVKDPSGVDLEFHQYTPQSSQRTGRDVEVDW